MLPILDSTAWVVPSAISSTKYLNLVAYAQQLQTLGTPPDNNITIAPDDGHLLVERFCPASALISPLRRWGVRHDAGGECGIDVE